MATGSVAALAGAQTSHVQPQAAPRPRSSNNNTGAAPVAQSSDTGQNSGRLANVAATSGRQVDVKA